MRAKSQGLASFVLPDEFVTSGLAFCNPDDGQTLPLLHTGLASSGGAMPYQMWKKSLGRRNWHFDFLELVIFRSPVIEFLLNDVSKIRN